jgi:hypothetical protein
MFRIKIEADLNVGSMFSDTWLIRFDHDGPVFTTDEKKAGVFSPEFNTPDSVHRQINALYDMYKLRGTPVAEGQVLETKSDKILKTVHIVVLALTAIFIITSLICFKIFG